MFRGVTFMVNDKMCITAGDNKIMCRIDPAIHDEVIKKERLRDRKNERPRIQGVCLCE